MWMLRYVARRGPSVVVFQFYTDRSIVQQISSTGAADQLRDSAYATPLNQESDYASLQLQRPRSLKTSLDTLRGIGMISWLCHANKFPLVYLFFVRVNTDGCKFSYSVSERKGNNLVSGRMGKCVFSIFLPADQDWVNRMDAPIASCLHQFERCWIDCYRGQFPSDFPLPKSKWNCEQPSKPEGSHRTAPVLTPFFHKGINAGLPTLDRSIGLILVPDCLLKFFQQLQQPSPLRIDAISSSLQENRHPIPEAHIPPQHPSA